MERVIQNLIIVATLCHLLEAFQQNVLSVVGDNLEIKFSTNATNFENAVLTFIQYKDYKERTIPVDGKKYRVERKTAQSLSFKVDSVDSSDAGKYVCTFSSTTIAVVRVTILDPKPNCTLSKQANGSISTSFEYVLLDCVFAYIGSPVPALKWTEDALIDIGVSPSSCKTYEQNVHCKIPIRFVHTVHSDALENALQSGSKNAIATYIEGCNQHKCYWERQWNVTGLRYTVRLDNSMGRFLGSFQCFVFPCRFLKRTIRSSCVDDKAKISELHIERVGLIGAVVALSVIVVVFGVLMVSSCVKNHYLKRRIDFYIDTRHNRLSQHEIRLTQSSNPLHVDESENNAQVRLVSFRAAEQPSGYIEMDFPQATQEVIHSPVNQQQSMTFEPITLPPIPQPSAEVAAAAATSRSHQTQNVYEPDRTEEQSSRSSEPPLPSAEYTRLTQRQPLQLPAYAALSQENKVEHVAEDQDLDSGAYVNVPKRTRSRSTYANLNSVV